MIQRQSGETASWMRVPVNLMYAVQFVWGLEKSLKDWRSCWMNIVRE